MKRTLLIVQLLHSPGLRTTWRVLLLLLIVAVCVLAFTPRPPGLGFDNADKLQHLAAFICLAGCAALSLGSGLRAGLMAGLGMLGFGVFIEAVQAQIPQRSADWQDVVADGIGVVLGLLAVALARKLWPAPMNR